LKIYNLSTQLGIQLESEIDGIRGCLVGRDNLVAQMEALNALGPPTKDPY